MIDRRNMLIGGGAMALSGCADTSAVLPAKPPEGALRVATHNVHYIWLLRETGPWSVGDWEERKEALDGAFKALDSDIVAFQEMESFARGSVNPVNLALDWLRDRNPRYGVAAAGDPAVFPSTQPIFYRRARLSLREEGWFFFSETPDVLYARTFNGSFPAFCSWAEFEDRVSGTVFTVFNVHFDFASGENRRRSAELVASRIRPRVQAGEAVFVVGDINAGLKSIPARALKAEGLSFVPVSGSTYHWNRGLHLTAPVDHIGMTDNIRALGDPVVIRRKFAGDWPSDHYPVLADFALR